MLHSSPTRLGTYRLSRGRGAVGHPANAHASWWRRLDLHQLTRRNGFTVRRDSLSSPRLQSPGHYPYRKGSPGCRRYSPPTAGRRCYQYYTGTLYGKKDPGTEMTGAKRQLPPTGARECGGQPRRRRRSTAKESDHRRTDPSQQYHLPSLVETLPQEFPRMQHMVPVAN